MQKTCVISQPTFLPWLGWFDLVDQSELMVLLDDVAFSKQSWQQRNRIRTINGLEFLSVPVKTSGRFGQLILDCELTDQRFVEKMLNTLQTNYAKAAFFPNFINELSLIMKSAASPGRLIDLNCALIAWIADKLEIKTPMILASSLQAGGRRGEHVAAICEIVGANHYISPAGAESYLIDDKLAFDQRGVSIWIQTYEHPQYTQCFNPFLPYASAIDLIFNEGSASGEIMRSGRRATRAILGHLKVIN